MRTGQEWAFLGLIMIYEDHPGLSGHHSHTRTHTHLTLNYEDNPGLSGHHSHTQTHTANP